MLILIEMQRIKKVFEVQKSFEYLFTHSYGYFTNKHKKSVPMSISKMARKVIIQLSGNLRF